MILKHNGLPVTHRSHQCWIFSYWGMPDVSPWIWTRFSPAKGNSERDWSKGGNLDTGIGRISQCAANPWWICCELDKGFSSGGCPRKPNFSPVSKPTSVGSPGGSKVRRIYWELSSKYKCICMPVRSSDARCPLSGQQSFYLLWALVFCHCCVWLGEGRGYLLC